MSVGSFVRAVVGSVSELPTEQQAMICSDILRQHGRCPPPDVCNMQQLHPGDYGDDDAFVKLLHEASAPLMLRHPVSALAAAWQLRDMAALLTLNGDDPVDGGVFHRGGTRLPVSMPLRDFFPSLHNGSVPNSSYVFLDVSEMPLASTSQPLGDVYERVSLLRDDGYAFARRVARGRSMLSAGGWGNGRAFHSHGPALNALIAGVKHWFVRKPNVGAAKLPEGLTSGEALPEGWEAKLWQCTQRAGDLLWIPNLLDHATVNFGDEVVGLFNLINDLGDSPLHVASQAGDEAAVRGLLQAGHAPRLHTRSKRGMTPLLYAASHGHTAVIEQLLEAGADLSAAADDGGQALHFAVAGGHATTVALLLRRGAAADASDGDGQTPHDIATRLGREDIARALVGALSDAAAARIVARDAELLSRPFVEAGLLLASASTGRRVFVHELSEVPLSEEFTTRSGNSVQRVDAMTVTLAGSVTLDAPLAEPTEIISAVQIAMQLPVGLFRGPAQARDERMMELLQQGIGFNSNGDFRSACAYFEAAYALAVRPGLLVSAANMRLKLGQLTTAIAMYDAVLAGSGLEPQERAMAARKLGEARALLKQQAEAPPEEPPDQGEACEAAAAAASE